jgi:branched-chain amino acid transport system ATP-binding protein
MDEPLEGLAPIIVEALLKALARLIKEESLTVILVEQHAKQALEVTQQALVLNRGRISYLGTSAELLADSRKLASLIVAA